MLPDVASGRSQDPQGTRACGSFLSCCPCPRRTALMVLVSQSRAQNGGGVDASGSRVLLAAG